MTRSLGVNCSGTYVFVALAIDGILVDVRSSSRLSWPAGSGDAERLQEMLDDLKTMLSELGPETVELLLPEGKGPSSSHRQLTPRISLETLLRLACVQLGIDVELLSRPTLRSRLGLPKKGTLSDHVEAALDPVGPYWTTGRSLASAAALGRDE